MNRTLKQWAVAGALVAGVALAPAARAEDAPSKTTVTALLDWYYQYSMNHPPAGAMLAGRAFDVKADSFSFALAKIDIVRNPSAKEPWGYTATITVGKTADLYNATEPGGTNTYKYLTQIYGTYVTPTKIPITIDLGKFTAWCGYEVLGANNNDNYSASLLFNLAQPFYHAGIRATAPLTPKLTAAVHLVNGWNNVEDDNGGKTLGAELVFTPIKPLTLTLNYCGGDEGGTTANGAGTFGGIGFPVPVVLNTQMVDFVGVWNATSKLKLATNVDYASAAKTGVAGGHWSGEAVYAKYQFTTPFAFALRAEHFEDTNGLRTGTAQNVNEITATAEYAWKNLVSRLEFRHDHAGSKFFPSGGGGSTNQDTILFAQLVKI